jgi:uncharacterized protein DUF3400
MTCSIKRPCASSRITPRTGGQSCKTPDSTDPVKILTSCASCLEGLARYRDDVALDADYIVVEIAKHVLGADWLTGYVRDANAGGIERVLV